ncbi:MAG TPA: hypothetical protein VGN98_13640 [Tianweitania sediminis]|jgi:hypothetical protein|nr:hypothetical protein [Tianweitania sediminis]
MEHPWNSQQFRAGARAAGRSDAAIEAAIAIGNNIKRIKHQALRDPALLGRGLDEIERGSFAPERNRRFSIGSWANSLAF